VIVEDEAEDIRGS